MSTMKDIARILSERSELSRQDAEQFVAAMFDQLKIGLSADEQVKVKGLGTFKVQTMRSRLSVDVNTGEKVVIGSHDRISFTPDKQMAESVNHPFAHFETVILNDGVEFDDVDVPSEEQSAESTQPVGKETSVMEQTSISEEPVVVVEPVVVEEPAAVVEPVAIEEPIVPEEPIVAEKPAVVENSIAESVEETIVVEEPIVVTEPVVLVEETKTDDESSENVDKTENENINDNSENDQITESDMQGFGENDKGLGNALVTIFICVMMLTIGFIVGRTTADITFDDIKNYVTGEKKEPVMDDATIVYTGEKEYEKHAAQDSLVADSLERAKAEKEKEMQKQEMEARMTSNSKSIAEIKSYGTAAEEKKQADKKVTDTATKKETADKPVAKKTAETKPAAKKEPEAKPVATTKYDSDPRVRTGAYAIIGVQEVVTVRSGQTLESISKAYLGPGMECYVEAINGTTVVKEGQKIKIPQLKLKKLLKK